MIHKTIEQIEARLRQGAEGLPEATRADLLQLLATLRHETDALSRTDADQARSIAGFAELSTHEATREAKDPQLLALALQGLSRSAEGFEESHPRLVQVVNAIANTLSSLGI